MLSTQLLRPTLVAVRYRNFARILLACLLIPLVTGWLLVALVVSCRFSHWYTYMCLPTLNEKHMIMNEAVIVVAIEF